MRDEIDDEPNHIADLIMPEIRKTIIEQIRILRSFGCPEDISAFFEVTDDKLTIDRKKFTAFFNKNHDEQFDWLRSRGFSLGVFLEAKQEYMTTHKYAFWNDRQMLDLCEKIARRQKEEMRQAQFDWLHSRGFSSAVITQAAKEWSQQSKYRPLDREILDLCEKIVRRSTSE